MSGKARRVPLAHVRNGVIAAEDGTAVPQVTIILQFHIA